MAVAGELLAHRSRLEQSLGLHRHLKLDIGEAESLRPDNLSVARHQQCDSRNVLPRHFGG